MTSNAEAAALAERAEPASEVRALPPVRDSSFALRVLSAVLFLPLLVLLARLGGLFYLV